jgi:hypothetical protein
LDRAFNTFRVGADVFVDAGVIGKGLGLGTNVGARLAVGERDFLLAEEEWPRILLEMGAPLGLAFIVWRVMLTLDIGLRAVAAWARRDVLPSLLFSAASIPLLIAQTGVPAILGYVAISGGVALASLNRMEVMPRPAGAPLPRYSGRRGLAPGVRSGQRRS